MNILASEPLCCTNWLIAEVPLPRIDLSHSLCEGYAERYVAVYDGDADPEFRDLAIEIPRHEALPQKFHAVHLGFDAAPAGVSAPSSLQGAAQILRCPQGRRGGKKT